MVSFIVKLSLLSLNSWTWFHMKESNVPMWTVPRTAEGSMSPSWRKSFPGPLIQTALSTFSLIYSRLTSRNHWELHHYSLILETISFRQGSLSKVLSNEIVSPWVDRRRERHSQRVCSARERGKLGYVGWSLPLLFSSAVTLCQKLNSLWN